MTDYQCPSCGGICKKSGCERENVALIGEVEPIAYEWRYWYQNGGYTRYLCGDKVEAEGYDESLLMDGVITPLFSADQLAAAVANERERCLTICEELEQHYSAIKDTALLNGDIDLSNAASGEPRACRAIAAAIRGQE